MTQCYTVDDYVSSSQVETNGFTYVKKLTNISIVRCVVTMLYCTVLPYLSRGGGHCRQFKSRHTKVADFDSIIHYQNIVWFQVSENNERRCIQFYY